MKNKSIFSNGWRDFGSDGLEYWLPTIIWVVFEINHFSFFEICIDFWTMDFHVDFFGHSFSFGNTRFSYSRTKLKTNKIERIQISFSCAMYWHFFQYYREDQTDHKIDILGMEIELNEENRF